MRKVSGGSVANKSTRKKPTIDEIIAAVSGLTQPPVSIDAIRGSDRSASTSWLRHIVMYLSRELTGLTLEAIGASLGGRDHPTVLYGINKVQESLKGPDGVSLKKYLGSVRKALK